MQRSSLLTRSVLLATTALTATQAFAGLAPAAQAASSSRFTEQAVNPTQFVVMAAPRNANDYNLVILEQKSSQRACWTENNGIIDPLLLNFDFSGICSRSTDSNGYSVRMAGEDLGLQYNLRLVNRGSYLSLLATPNRRGQSTFEIGRTKTASQNYLAVDLQPGWELSRRVFDGKPLGHIYFSSAQAVANTIATAPTQPSINPTRPAATPVSVIKPVSPPPAAAQPVVVKPETKPAASDIVSVGTPLPKPPMLPGRQPVAQAPIAIPVEQPPAPVAKPVATQPINQPANRPLNQPVTRPTPVGTPNPLANQRHYDSLNPVYQEVLSRSVDAAGLSTYGKRLDEGKTIAWVRDRLRNSSEGQSVAINRVYREVLGRDADAKGLAHYQKRMERGWSLSRVRSDVASSGEAQRRLANR